MRQVHLQVPRGRGVAAAEAARELGASTLTRVEASGGDGSDVDLLVVTVPNANVEALLDRAQQLGTVEASVPATGAFAFEPPAGEVPEELLDVTPVSGHEVVLAGRQAAGTWRGFLSYSAVAGAIVWLGLLTETIYLLTGSMLIAPFAGPAMNTAIAIASGRAGLLRHSVARYAAGIGLAAAVSAVLTAVIGPEIASELMVDVLGVTTAAVLLPLAAGIAGATFLVHSEHSSLVSGAAVGVLVAASLAPPAGGLGMALALGRSDLVVHAAFVIALQLTGITLTAVAVLWLYGIRPDLRRYGGGHGRLLPLGMGAAALLTVVLVAAQLASAPTLTQGTRANQAAAVVSDVIEGRGDLGLLQVDASVASARDAEPPRIVAEVTVEQHDTAGRPPVVRERVTSLLRGELAERLPDVISYVDVTVLDAHPRGPDADVSDGGPD